ncbi:TPA: hypothetical protein MYP33_004982 [Enterobacter kobei]|nr:hypothetical protein [Enterobacter kobei]HCC8328887.1 hypothetical protein [Enterobacter kobei]
MFGFFRKKISSNQVDLYVSDKILGVAKKVVAIVEANGVTIVDGEGVVFLAAGLFLNATWGRFRKRKIKHAKPSFHPPASSGMTLAVSVWGMPQLDVRPER